MKIMKTQLGLLLATTFLFISSISIAQETITPYDRLPGMEVSYKPSYQSDYPEWAKMLYQYPVNYYEINRAYEDYARLHPGEKSPVIRYYKIWRKAIQPYVKNDGLIELPDLESLKRSLLSNQMNASSQLKSANVSSASWTFLGPKQTWWLNSTSQPEIHSPCPWQVNIYSIDVAPSNYNIIYAGSETGFISKTVDKGKTWQFIASDYFFGGGIRAIAVHPTNPDIVYVAAGSQIHGSGDGGQTWYPLLPIGGTFRADRLKINPGNHSMLVAAAQEGIYISTNAGVSWSKKTSSRTWDIEFKPDNNNIIFGIANGSDGMYKVFQSNDSGISFQEHSTFPDINMNAGAMLAVTPDNPNVLFAVMLSLDRTPYMYKGTSLSGATYNWSLLATGITNAFPMDNGQGYFDLVLEVSPNDENVIFAGTTTLFKSHDGGASFSYVGGYKGDFNIHPDIQDMKILPTGETWVATDGGISLSTDLFQTQENYSVHINGLMGSHMWGFDQGWNEDIVVGGRYHNGNTAMSDYYGDKALRMGGAENPTGWVLHGRSRHVAFYDLYSHTRGLILPQEANGIIEGLFPFAKYPNMDSYGGRRGNFLIHPNYYNTYLVGEGNGFWKSLDGGESYDLLYEFPDRVRYMQISHVNPDIIFADVMNHGLYKTEDGGVTWSLKGLASWSGSIFFALSSYDESVIYACKQDGNGVVYRSIDGGSTWTNWSTSTIVNTTTKNLVVQPTKEGADLVYLINKASAKENASVYFRRESDNDWTNFSTGLPGGIFVNLTLPFFRDAKIRVACNAGVWESPLEDQDFTPVLNPCCQGTIIKTATDTVFFDDHSMINHSGASWHWEFNPAAKYISDPNSRNPKVLFEPGVYDVTMSITQNGQTYSKTIPSMLTVKKEPSIYDCSNPGEVPKNEWKVIYVDSEETDYKDLSAEYAFDGDLSTIWHTQWYLADPLHPHEIQIDLGNTYNLSQFTYWGRQNSVNGRIKDYELYISDDPNNWGTSVSTGVFNNSISPQIINLGNHKGRYARLVAYNAWDNNEHTTVAEMAFIGCLEGATMVEDNALLEGKVKVYPIPTNGIVYLSMLGDSYKTMDYSVFSVNGQLITKGTLQGYADEMSIDLSACNNGLYFIHLLDENGVLYRTKVLKK